MINSSASHEFYVIEVTSHASFSLLSEFLGTTTWFGGKQRECVGVGVGGVPTALRKRDLDVLELSLALRLKPVSDGNG